MSDSQIAKIIMALNSLDNARSILNDAIKEGGDVAPSLNALMNKLKDCETELRLIQYQK
ncbi:MAG: hypothetical protein ACM3YE_14305 [Bacteroidota bacterium]